MPESVNAAEFEAFAAKLKQAERKVRGAVRKGIRDAVRPLTEGVVAEGAEGLPSGLAAHVVGKGARPQTRQSAKAVTVVFGKKAGPQIGAMDEGSVRHPTFGRKPWVSQSIPAGTFSEALEGRLPEVRKAVAVQVEKAMGEF